MALDEQKLKEVKKLNREFFVKSFVLSSLYGLGLFLSNLVLTLFIGLYPSYSALSLFLTVGTSLVICMGWNNSLRELYEETTNKIKKLSEDQIN